MPQSGSSGSGTTFEPQRFDDVLDSNGELPFEGTNLTNLALTITYTSLPPDSNCKFWVDVIDDDNAIIKNTGGAANAGASVKGYFA
jgi:hypothetical protein